MMFYLSMVDHFLFFFFSSRRRHTRCLSDWSSDVCSSDLGKWLAVPAVRSTYLIDAKTGILARTVAAPREGWVHDARFSPDSSTLAIAGDGIDRKSVV